MVERCGYVMLNRLKHIIGEKINGRQFNIDIINSCSLRCPSCPIGSFAPRHGIMSIDMFKNILDKAQKETKIRKIQMYAFSDPCLHPDLHLFIEECTRRGIETSISTPLQTSKCDFRKVIEARPTEFRISYPGLNKMSYFQRGAKPELFMKKFYEVVALPRYKETKWNMLFQLYNDNYDEVKDAQLLADMYGLHLIVLPAIFIPTERMVGQRYTKEDLELISHLQETPEHKIGRMDFQNTYCELWKQTTIGATGEVYLCCVVFDKEFNLCNYLDTPLKEIKKIMQSHPFCSKCLDFGGHAYHLCYADMTKFDDPIKKADKKRGLIEKWEREEAEAINNYH